MERPLGLAVQSLPGEPSSRRRNVDHAFVVHTYIVFLRIPPPLPVNASCTDMKLLCSRRLLPDSLSLEPRLGRAPLERV